MELLIWLSAARGSERSGYGGRQPLRFHGRITRTLHCTAACFTVHPFSNASPTRRKSEVRSDYYNRNL